METTLIILVSVLSLLVLALIIVIVILVLKFLKMKDITPQVGPHVEVNYSTEQISPEVGNDLEHAKNTQESTHGKFCIDHPELPAKGLCSISNKLYCELCITKEDDIKLARKFLNLYLDSDWETLFFLNNESTGPDKLNEFMRVKKQIWKEEKLPIITQKQFKINIEDDQIEAFTMVKVRNTDEKYIKKRLEFLDS